MSNRYPGDGASIVHLENVAKSFGDIVALDGMG